MSKNSTVALIIAPWVDAQLVAPLITTGAPFIAIESHAARVASFS